jgi:hypothetical protein
VAGDWIKMRSNLWDDPRVAAVCDACGCGEAQAVGALYWLWATADQHSEDGLLAGMTARQIDRKTGVTGFASALESVGWLLLTAEGAQVVRFEEHNGASAKRRASESRRKMSARDADKMRTEGGIDAEGERTDGGSSAHLEKEIEEEKKQELSSSLRSDSSSAGADDGQQQGKEAQKPDKAQRLAQVTQEAITAFNAKLGKPKGNLPSVRLVTKERLKQVQRCTQVAALIAKDRYGDSRLTPQFWEDYFEVVSKDPFWSGRQPPGEGHENWVPDFENLTHPKHMARLFERAVADEPMAGAA